MSVLGVYLARLLVGAEVLFIPAIDRDMPRFLARQNEAQVPIAALIMTSAATQVFLIVALFSENAFDLLLDLTASVTIFPYLLSAAYGFKVPATRDGYRPGASVAGHLVISALAIIFAAWLLYSAGVGFTLVSCVVYALGTVLYLMARRETRQRLFLPYEAVVCGLLILAALAGVVGLVTGRITI